MKIKQQKSEIKNNQANIRQDKRKESLGRGIWENNKKNREKTQHVNSYEQRMMREHSQQKKKMDWKQ